MKKYPFSKKAVQSILAVSLALTPAATFGGVEAQAAETEGVVTAAAYYDTNELLTKLNQIYAELNKPANAAVLEKIQQAQEKLKTINWTAYAEQLVNSNDQDKINALAQLLESGAKVATSSIPAELQESLQELSKTCDEIAGQFGQKVTAEEIKGFIIGSALECYNNVKKLSANATEAEINDALEQAIAVALLKHPNLSEVMSRNINLSELKKTAKAMIAEIDPDGEIRKAFVQVVKQVEGGTPGSGGSSPDPEPEPIPYTPGAHEVVIPKHATKMEETANGFVRTILANKVDEVTGLLTDAKYILVLPLPQGATGQVNKAVIPGSLLKKAAEKNAKAVLFVKTTEAGYKLPVQAIDVSKLAQQLNASIDDIQIELTVKIVPTSEVQGTINNHDLNPVSPVIEFTIKAKAGNQEKHIGTFNTFVEREIVAHKELNPNRTAALRLNEDGTISPVPATFSGKTGIIKSMVNSKYVLVENDKTFVDVNNGANFFEEHIEKLASKYIIKGKTDTTYAPSENITRGEFAALISRGLGLEATNLDNTTFPDVSRNQAVNKNGEIFAAVEAGIIKGFPDGTFKPEQPITRAEAAIMIDRAMKFTNVPESKFDSSKKVADFKDAESIGISSRDSIEKVLQAGIMDGFQNGEFGAYKYTQRDQMAKVIDKFLQTADFIN